MNVIQVVATVKQTSYAGTATTPSKTEFKMNPQQQELGAIERDLRFHPVVNDNPRLFTAAQLAASQPFAAHLFWFTSAEEIENGNIFHPHFSCCADERKRSLLD